ncbi:MAG: DUF6588 family protein [Chryseolinea sp.]
MDFKKKPAIFFGLILTAICAQAQDENDLTYFLNAGKGDASKLIGAYLNPAIKGLSYGFNGGWYSSAKVHKTLGFDLSVTLNGVFVPAADNYFNPASLKLEAISSFTSNDPNGQAPTIMGPDIVTTYSVDADKNGTPEATFKGPRGIDFKNNIKIQGVAAPTANLSLGIYKNTDLKIRYMPEVKRNSTSIKAFGVGVMHDIKQHLPGMKILPFDLSVLVAYTNIKGSTGMENTFAKPAGDARKQELLYNMNAWLFQALISKKLAILTFYGGIGFNTAKTSADAKGSYIIPSTNVALKDPVSLDFSSKSARISAGMRLNLGPVYLNGEYVLQKYSMVSVGIGVSIREIKIY